MKTSQSRILDSSAKLAVCFMVFLLMTPSISAVTASAAGAVWGVTAEPAEPPGIGSPEFNVSAAPLLLRFRLAGFVPSSASLFTMLIHLLLVVSNNLIAVRMRPLNSQEAEETKDMVRPNDSRRIPAGFPLRSRRELNGAQAWPVWVGHPL